MAKEKKSKEMEKFSGLLTSYKKDFEKWETRVGKILRTYRDEFRTNERGEGEVRFNILWSNVQTLVPATYSKVPKADVSRRYRDQDDAGRVASLILERALEYELSHYPDFRETMKSSVLDRFLGGRGTSWIRYEPHIKAAKEQLPQDGLEVTEDVDTPGEELDYECSPVDYVHWKDFGHGKGRTWEEVPCVWRRVYMQMDAKEERFPEKFEDIPKDARPSDDRYPKQQQSESSEDDGSWIYELWDKTQKKVYWFHKGMKNVLDERDDPLGLEGFFPCPKPLYATLTNDSLIPVPDFSLYQDQAKSLDTLADRIYGLVNMLQVKGVYDGSADKAIGRLFTEGGNGNLIPVKNWAAFAEKNGLKGSVDIMDLDPISRALKEAYTAFAQIIQFIYQITGIADIVRGVSDPNETLGAQEIKKNFVGLRLGDMKMGVAQFATEIIQLKAQVMCAQFDPQTILRIAAVDQLSPEDQQLIGPAMELLVGPERMMNPEADSPNPMRSFRIEVQADSLVQIDEQAEKESRLELMTAFGTYLEKGSMLAAQAPQTIPLIVEIGKFVVQSFKAGKNVEGTFDTLLDQLKTQGPMPNPEQMKEQALQQATAEVTQQNATKEIGLQKKSADLDLREQVYEATKQVDQIKREAEEQRMIADHEKRLHELEMAKKEVEHTAKNAERELGMKEKETEISTKAMEGEAELAEKKANIERETTEKSQSQAALNEQTIKKIAEAAKTLTEAIDQLNNRMDKVEKLAAAKKRIIRNPQTGRAEGIEAVQ